MAQPDLSPATETVTRRIDPFLMSVLKSRFEAIVREMTDLSIDKRAVSSSFIVLGPSPFKSALAISTRLAVGRMPWSSINV